MNNITENACKNYYFFACKCFDLSKNKKKKKLNYTELN